MYDIKLLMHKSTTRLSSHQTEDQSMPLLDTVKSETAREWYGSQSLTQSKCSSHVKLTSDNFSN
ncbi:hypothetical protein PCASD_17331 [Puccinia coronata f. sp. avenae]|uniref:Uncharacterized protein n=1 Tax=Puccinia coronata f. sp. avenae TaxID=200324 RepID=A0A2N5U6Q2_9BASI|nr:hypothetical protein PCASD_17331 [Puccinia coronata f. sp. avenae]